MKHKLFLMTSLVTSLTATGCYNPPLLEHKTSYDYADIKDFSIDFDNIFKQVEDYYFVYIYSLKCLHCELIKEDVISYSLSEKMKTYFMKYDQRLQIVEDVAPTIGKNLPQEVGILGTPSLFLIEGRSLALNVAGMDLVKNVLSEYN